MSSLFSSVVIESMKSYFPEEVLTSVELENRLSPLYDRFKLSVGRLELMTGIAERRVARPGTRPSELAVEAGKRVLLSSRIPREKIGVLIHASVCRDFLEPATASRVHRMLELPAGMMVFDLSNACLGVLNAWFVVAQMIESGQIEAGIVVAGEDAGPLLSRTIEILLNLHNSSSIDRRSLKKYFANFTLGSGAFASLLTRKELAPTSPRLLGGSYLCHSQASDLCTGSGNLESYQMETDAEALLHEGIHLAEKNWQKTKQVLSWSDHTPQHFITHQVGKAHSQLLYKKLNIDPEKDFSTFPFFGNTGSVALPSALTMAAERGRFRSGDLIGLLGIGSGLNSIMLGLEWNSEESNRDWRSK